MAGITNYFETQNKFLRRAQISKEPSQGSATANCKIVNPRDEPDSSENRALPDDDMDEAEASDIASGSEYYPSEESETEYLMPSTSKSRPRGGSKLTKHYDDGNVDRFNSRINQFKLNKKSKSKKNRDAFHHTEEDDSLSDSSDDCHQLTGGLNVPNCIWKKLYRYQKTGVKWLWELHQMESGGLLGDEMGLGKTIQVIAFLAALSVSRMGRWAGLGPSLIVAPATVLHQWVLHCHEWWPPFRVAVLHSSGSHQGAPDRLIRDIHVAHGILVTTYTGIIKHRASIEARQWHYIILDEGHKIRNSDTQVSKAVRKIRTPHRIVVTGSPMQNNLQELWSLFDFMSPGLLGSLHAFVDHFATPITQGGYTNASKLQETMALSLATTLKDVISPYMLRRTKAQVRDHLKLPEKKEQVLFCSLSDEQKDLYKSFLLSNTVRSILDKESRYGDPVRARILVALSTLRKICNHPDLFLCQVDDDLPEESVLPTDVSQSFGFWKRAGKMVVINSLLKIWKKQGHRVLIFTQSRAMICVLEMFLQQNDYKYLKMDGTTSIGTRQPIITLFNTDDSYLVFLATTRVGGLGVNLTGADRVIIYDPDWNPAVDTQAKERAWRIGQIRDVTIYRLLSAGTVEEKIYQRQIFKQLLGNKVLLDPNQKNYLKTSTLQGLFSLEEPDKAGATETTNIFKHTQIKSNRTPEVSRDTILLNGSVSFSKTKMDAMRRLAQQISKNITSSAAENTTKEKPEDPREKYKKKLLLPPPTVEVPPVNIHNDQETKANFATVLSEIDIVNLYSKPEPLDFLSWDQDNVEPQENLSTRLNATNDDMCQDEMKNNENTTEKNCSEGIEKLHVQNKSKKHKKRKRKEKDFEALLSEDELNEDEEFRRLIKKVKKKKHRSDPVVQEDPDQYVLEKLFAKSGVQSALQHDKVVGLAEREDAHRMQSQAQQRAMLALKALRKSRIKNWRW